VTSERAWHFCHCLQSSGVLDVGDEGRPLNNSHRNPQLHHLPLHSQIELRKGSSGVMARYLSLTNHFSHKTSIRQYTIAISDGYAVQDSSSVCVHCAMLCSVFHIFYMSATTFVSLDICHNLLLSDVAILVYLSLSLYGSTALWTSAAFSVS
jgi:hypothetical protein